MPLSTPDMTWNDYGSNCRGDGMTDFFYCQPRELPCDPFNQDWQWTACSATASPPVRTAVSSSQTMQTANSGQYFDPSMISSGTSNLHSVGVKNTTPNFGLTPFSGNSISFFNPHPGHVPPVDHQSMLFRGQAECEEKTYKNKGYNQTSGTQAHAYHQPIIKKTKKTSRLNDHRTAQPLHCEWKGCGYSGSFKRESLLIRHLKTLHFYSGSHPCPIEDCDMICNRKDNLMQHMRNIHS